ncbi:MAG: FAD-dependent oxidoreductase [Actinomycetota bacterium]
MEPSPIVVVGAGLAGLTAANHLADAGHRVTIVETRRDVGGRARTDAVDGFRLNLGPHALYRDGAGMAVLDALGIDAPGWDVPVTESTAADGDRLVGLPVGPMSLLRTGLLGVRGKLQVGRLLTRLPKLDPADWHTTSVDDWIAESIGDEGARRLVHALARLTTYSARPDLASAGALIAQLQGATTSGVRYLHGGWQVLADRLLDRAHRRGAELRSGVAVRAVRSVGSGFEVDADVALTASAVVLAVPPAAADRLLGGGTGLADAAGPEVVASVLDLGLDGLPARRFVLGIDRPHYLSRHAPAADLAPDGTSLVGVMRYGEPGERDPKEVRAELLDLAIRSGIAPQQILLDRYLHRLVVAGGMPLAASGGLAGRPGVEVPGRPGALVAGDWVGDEGQLADASFASGRAAAVAALRFLGDRRAAEAPVVGASDT